MEVTEFQVLRQLPGAGSITLEGEWAGDGPPVVLLHGLSATRRNVVQGSRALVKRGYRLISYDARGHGASSPAPRYEYSDLVADLEAVLDHLEIERAALVGSSMGAATAMAFTLEHPERVPALVQITPAYTGYARTGDVDGEVWDKLATALDGGVDEFVQVAQPQGLPERWREVAREATRQRMERHEHLDAVGAGIEGDTALRGLEGPRAAVVARGPGPDRGLPGRRGHAPPARRGRGVPPEAPERGAGGRGQGRFAAGVAGSAAVGVIGDFLERVGYPEAQH